MREPCSYIFQWFANNWISLFLLVLLFAVFQGFYDETKNYLGETVKAKVQFEEFPQNAAFEPHLSLKVVNNENADLTQCYATLVELKHFYNPTTTLDILEKVNPNNLNMTWGGGSPTEYITIHPGIANSKVLNICKGTTAGLVFLFTRDWNAKYQSGKFMAKVMINGLLGDRRIEPKQVEFCFEFGLPTQISRERVAEEIGVGVRQNIIIQASSTNMQFAFMDCPNQSDTKGHLP